MRDPYKTLGVKRDAGPDEIKSAWRTMAKEVHPDHNPNDPTATARFTEIGRAYETLKDPKKRNRYDQVSNMAQSKSNEQTIMQQRQAAREAAERAKAAKANAEKVMEELARVNAQKAQQAATAAAAAAAAGGRPAGAKPTAAEPPEDMVERIFGAKAAPHAPNTDAGGTGAAGEARPDAARADAGGSQHGDSVSEAEPVVAAGGIASIISLAPFGIFGSLVRRITGAAPALEKAPDIAAEASITVEDIIKNRWITVTLSDGREVRFQAVPGIGDGHVVHLKGQGLKLQGMERGDLAITVHLAADNRFNIRGYDLHTSLPITIENAVLGWQTSVQGPNGAVSIKIPAWSGSDHIVRISGEGLPNGAGGRGDLVVELRLMLWERPDEKMTDLMRVMKNGLVL